MNNEKAPITFPIINLEENKTTLHSSIDVFGKKRVSYYEIHEDVFFKIDAILTCTSFDKEVTQINVSGILYYVPLPKKEVFEKVMKWMEIDGYRNNCMIKEFKEYYKFQ